jgi:hypothetical protein
MILLVLLLIFPLGQVVDTNELERESREGKINSKISKIIRWDSWYKWARVTVKSGEYWQ